MTEPSNLEAIMGLIMYGGEAKGKAVEAIHAASIKTIQPHHQLLLGTANVSAIYGQDHMMTALAFIDLAKELVTVYDKMSAIQRGES